MKKSDKIFSGIIIGLVALLFIGLISGFIGSSNSKTDLSDQDVLVIKLQGTITTSGKFVKKLRKYAEKDDIKAIVLRVNSPGGSVGASQEIYSAVKNIRKSGKPVIVSMGSTCASGGYYVALGGSKIMANPGTVTGSIGVIVNFPVFEELMNKVGIEGNTIKSGKYKDTGSPMRKMTESDSLRFKKIVEELYGQFVNAIIEERPIKQDKLKEVADGRVLTGQTAERLGLIDTLGTLHEAVNYAGDIVGVQNPDIVRPKKERTTLLDLLLKKDIKQMLNIKNEQTVKFKYLLK